MSTTTSQPQRSTAPQLLFDDGSRAIQENAASSSPPSAPARDPSISIREYYEVDRLVQELGDLRDRVIVTTGTWKDRIALQFPDELLMDGPEVCWEFEQRLSSHREALVFILGDTTYQSCCPDVVAARHLNADCIIHYGHACLSHATLPVLYSFGTQALSIESTVDAVVRQKQADGNDSSTSDNLLVLYEVKYAHAIQELQRALQPHFQSVMMGRIPSSHLTPSAESSCEQSTCGCAPTSNNSDPAVTIETSDSTKEPALKTIENDNDISTDALILGGLEIPSCEDWSSTTLLFVGQEEASRPLQNIMLRFLTDTEHAPAAYWTWNPVTETLSTQASPHLSRLLNRRFYLVQKAKLARIFGILVANPSDRTTRPVVRHLQALLLAHGAAHYNFMVGKINPNKLANFAEVDAYCLVACPEHALLENERSDYMTPVLTPLEVYMALGGLEWGSAPYSLDSRYFLNQTQNVVSSEQAGSDINDDEGEEQDDDDAPYFNPVTGRYESALKKEDDTIDLSALPGKGQLTAYQSAAADFLRQREYQGLSVDAGQTPVQAATMGQHGIASNYGDQ